MILITLIVLVPFLIFLLTKGRHITDRSIAGYTIEPTDDRTHHRVTVKAGSVPSMTANSGVLLATAIAVIAFLSMGTSENAWTVAIITWVIAAVALAILSKFYFAKSHGRHPGGTFTVSKGGIEWPDGQKLDNTLIHRLVIKNTAKVPRGALYPSYLKVVEVLQSVSWRLDVEAGGKAYPLAGGMTETVAEGLMHELKTLLDFSGQQAEAAETRTRLKPCPFCAEPIRKEAIKCKHCGSALKA